MPPPTKDVRVAALDLGKARVGVAISDELGLLAHPRPALDGRNLKALLASLSALAVAESLTRFVVGMPRTLDDRTGIAAQRAVRFCEKLANHTRCEVELIDERLTTVEASRRLREGGADRRQERERIDSASAAIILQQWLDTRR
ncbi:MAG: Holliday junction resolvase RuvX [Myxococcales bacterium]|nr:Holliday junction resolvase RuvX [Myxococcales bacterium]